MRNARAGKSTHHQRSHLMSFWNEPWSHIHTLNIPRLTRRSKSSSKEASLAGRNLSWSCIPWSKRRLRWLKAASLTSFLPVLEALKSGRSIQLAVSAATSHISTTRFPPKMKVSPWAEEIGTGATILGSNIPSYLVTLPFLGGIWKLCEKLLGCCCCATFFFEKIDSWTDTNWKNIFEAWQRISLTVYRLKKNVINMLPHVTSCLKVWRKKSG